MKTFEKNQNPQDNNPTNQPNQTNQPTPTKQPDQTPGSQIQDPTKRPLDPAKKESPVKEPGKQQPYVDPDPTSPEKNRTDPYAGDKTRQERKENSGDIRRNESDIDTNPTGETKQNPQDVTKGNQSNNPRKSEESDIDHEDHEI
jgi:hypothetical protein